jgi:hypothetical protein
MARSTARGSLPGWKIRAQILSVDRSLRVFDANARELADLLDAGSELPSALELWAQANRVERETFLDEVDRLLHNYLAAATSLRDHSRNVQRKLLAESETDRLAAEYTARRDATFTTSTLSQFVQRLRNYSQHSRLPITRGRAHYSRESGFDASVVIPKSELLKSGKWEGLAKRFLDESDDELVLREIMADYNEAVRAFHAWFRKALIHATGRRSRS